LLAAEALALTGELDAAALELRAARAAFLRLGARRDAQATDERLRRQEGTGALTAGADAIKTFVFTDIVSSTDLIGVIGDEAWAAARGWHDTTLRALFSAHGGEEVSHTGDGFFVAFTEVAPALVCAVEIQRTLERHRHDHGFALPVRVGVHAARAAHTPDGYAGRGVHVAARIGALAAAGEILISTSTLADAAADISVGPTRVATLKGLPEPLELACVEWK